MSSTQEERASASGSLKERPFARLLQQLFRKQVTGRLHITDGAGDESDVYLRAGMPVHVQRPVDPDRLDRVLVEAGVVSAEEVAQVAPMVADGMHLGEALERIGALGKETLAGALEQQLRRQLIRLFRVAQGSFAIYLEAHPFGEGDELAARVDPRTVFFPAIRAAYDVPRATRELSRLWGQEFRLAAVSPADVAAMGIPSDDHLVAALRAGWQKLEKLDSVSARPLEARTLLLSLYYAELLQRKDPGARPAPEAAPRPASTERLVATPGGAVIAQVPAPPLVTPAIASAPPPAARAPVPRADPVRPNPSTEATPRVAGARAPGSANPAAPVPDAGLRIALLQLAQKLGTLSHFQLLGVSEGATPNEVNSAFLAAARRFHPDRLAGAGLSDLVPQAERILARLSEAAMILGDPERRAEYLAARVAKKPVVNIIPAVMQAEATFVKGEVFLKRGDYDKAIEHFAAASKANPAEPQFRAYWAWARFDNPRERKETVVREVQRIIADAVTAQPRFARGHYWLGQIYKYLNEPDRAERAFREAVNQDGDFIEASREMRLLEMRRTRSGMPRKDSDPPRGGMMSRLFKK
jgi:curved DNA-binding protein CbpA